MISINFVLETKIFRAIVNEIEYKVTFTFDHDYGEGDWKVIDNKGNPVKGKLAHNIIKACIQEE